MSNPTAAPTAAEIRWKPTTLAYVLVAPGAPDSGPPLIDRCDQSIAVMRQVAARHGMDATTVVARPGEQIERAIRDDLSRAMRAALLHESAGVDAFERVATSLVRSARCKLAEVPRA